MRSQRLEDALLHSERALNPGEDDLLLEEVFYVKRLAASQIWQFGQFDCVF